MAKDVDDKDELDNEEHARDSSDEVDGAEDGVDGDRPSTDEAEGDEAEGDEGDEATAEGDEAEGHEAAAKGDEVAAAPPAGDEAGDDSVVPAHLGDATKYVHAAFFGAGILVAYLSGKLIAAAWSELAEWPAAVQAVPQLLRYAEDDRGNITLIMGAFIGIIAVIQTYRKEGMRQWADDVATELAKVTWPVRETVTNGTIVVIIASLIATTYIGLLDRLWGFLTNLVYGA